MIYRSLLLLLCIIGFVACEEQKEKALEYYKNKTQPKTSNSTIEKFGFDEKATPNPTPKVVIPFDNERTRQDANN